MYRRRVGHSRLPLPALALTLTAVGCSPSAPTPMNNATASASANGLTISFTVRPGVEVDRVPMRTLLLHFRNVGKEPIRVFLPQAEAFRAAQSVVSFVSGKERFMVPEPRPHGYAISEIDFPLIAPGEERTFEQRFTLDPMKPSAGTATARRPGFEDGATVQIAWSYRNDLTRWRAGQATLDGPTRTVFGGGDIPGLWRGNLSVSTSWVVR